MEETDGGMDRMDADSRQRNGGSKWRDEGKEWIWEKADGDGRWGVEKVDAGIRWRKRMLTADRWMKEIDRGSNEEMEEVVAGSR